jgi:polygalacturonase
LRCREVSVTDLTLKPSACWLQTYRECEDVVLSDIEVEVPVGKPDAGYPHEGPPPG